MFCYVSYLSNSKQEGNNAYFPNCPTHPFNLIHRFKCLVSLLALAISRDGLHLGKGVRHILHTNITQFYAELYFSTEFDSGHTGSNCVTTQLQNHILGRMLAVYGASV